MLNVRCKTHVNRAQTARSAGFIPTHTFVQSNGPQPYLNSVIEADPRPNGAAQSSGINS